MALILYQAAKNKLVFAEIVKAHSPTAIKKSLKSALAIIDESLAKDDFSALVGGAYLLNEVIARYSLLKESEELAATMLENDPSIFEGVQK
jgi:hypothetical protein